MVDACALLRWDQRQLAQAADISVKTVKRLEKSPGKVSAYTGALEVIQKALDKAGVEFTNDDAPGMKSGQGRQAGLLNARSAR